MDNNQVTRETFIKTILARFPERIPDWAMKNSFAAWGYRTKYFRAMNLLHRLEEGGLPSVNETVGYFGKGSRFINDQPDPDALYGDYSVPA